MLSSADMGSDDTCSDLVFQEYAVDEGFQFDIIAPDGSRHLHVVPTHMSVAALCALLCAEYGREGMSLVFDCLDGPIDWEFRACDSLEVVLSDLRDYGCIKNPWITLRLSLRLYLSGGNYGIDVRSKSRAVQLFLQNPMNTGSDPDIMSVCTGSRFSDILDRAVMRYGLSGVLNRTQVVLRTKHGVLPQHGPLREIGYTPRLVAELYVKGMYGGMKRGIDELDIDIVQQDTADRPVAPKTPMEYGGPVNIFIFSQAHPICI